MDDLLIKYILEEATPEENDRVQQWLTADAANRAHFEGLQAVWQVAALPNLQPATDTPQALQRLKQTLKARETASIKRIWPRVRVAVAAVVGFAVVSLGVYFWMNPKATVKEQLPVAQPDTVLQQPVQIDTVLTVPPVTTLPTDTIPIVKPHKKTRPVQVTPVKPIHPKKKAAQPTQVTDTMPVKKKRPAPVQSVHPVKKHKSATPQVPVKEPPIS